MEELSSQHLTFMHPVFRGCNMFEAIIIFILTLAIAITCAFVSKLVINYFLIPLFIFAILTQVFLFKYLCRRYGDYKSNKPPGVANLKVREYLSFIGIKPKHITRVGKWRVGGTNV